MSRLPTKTVEDIYSMLEKYAEASPRYYDREGFIYSFGVISNPPKKFRLTCFDNRRRTFIKDGDIYKVEGPNSAKINSLIKHIILDNSGIKTIEDFNVTETRI